MNKMKTTIQNLLNIKGSRQVLTVFVALIFITAVFSLMNPNFLSIQSGNLPNMIRDTGPLLIIGIGQALVLLTGNIDLSIGAVVSSSGMLAGVLMYHGGFNPLLACLVALFYAVAVGFVNGQLVSRFKLPPFIATLGTMFICNGIVLLLNNNAPTGNIADGIGTQAADTFQNLLFYNKIGIFSVTVFIAFFIWFAVFILLYKTKWGRHIYAIGSNPEAATLSGVSVQKTTTMVYMLSSFFAGVVAIILLAKSAVASTNTGATMEMYAVAVAVIGSISTLGGQGLLIGTIVGAAMWTILQNGLRMSGLPEGFRFIIIGAIVIVAVLLDIIVRKSQDKNVVFKGFFKKEGEKK